MLLLPVGKQGIVGLVAETPPTSGLLPNHQVFYPTRLRTDSFPREGHPYTLPVQIINSSSVC